MGGTYGEKTVTLETTLGDVEYTMFGFSNGKSAEKFIAIANKQAYIGEVEEIKYRLGHGHLLKQSKSIKYAGKVAMQKVNDQPEKKERITPQETAEMNPLIGV